MSKEDFDLLTATPCCDVGELSLQFGGVMCGVAGTQEAL